MARGQASLMDILLLGFSISLVGVFSLTSGNSRLSSHIMQEESAYTDSMLKALMAYTNETYGDYQNPGNLTLAQALDLWYCGPGDSSLEDGLNRTIRYLLDRLAKPGYNYIFYTGISSSGPRQLLVYNRQPSVEMDRMALRSFSLAPTCGCQEFFPPTLGIWPGWRNLPEGKDA